MNGTARKILVMAMLLAVAFSTAGCIRITRKASGGGVYKSEDGSETWTQKVFVSKDKKGAEKTINHVNVEKMAMSPKDTQKIYVGTREDGMYVTEDGGETWKSVLTDKGYVANIAIDPADDSTVYAAMGNRVLKTEDGGENWDQVYLETVPKQTVTALAVDSYDTATVYIGISDGRILKSANYGSSWTVVYAPSRKDQVKQILINESNTRIVYVAYATAGIFKTEDGGQEWKDAGAGLKGYSKANYFRFGAVIPSRPDALVIAADYGLLVTNDGGASWQPVKLLTSPGTMSIYSLAVSPGSGNEMYYGTATAIYKTTDGGNNWLARSLPTDRAAAYLLIDPADTGTVYLGANKVK